MGEMIVEMSLKYRTVVMNSQTHYQMYIDVVEKVTFAIFQLNHIDMQFSSAN